MVHDWFVHKKGAWTHTHDIPLDAGDSLARAADACAEDAGGPAEGGRIHAPAGLHQREHALVGRLAGLRQLARQRRRRCAPDATARCSSARAGGSVSTRSPARRSPVSPRTAGSV